MQEENPAREGIHDTLSRSDELLGPTSEGVISAVHVSDAGRPFLSLHSSFPPPLFTLLKGGENTPGRVRAHGR